MNALGPGDALIGLVASRGLHDAVTGDLHERFQSDARSCGSRAAMRSFYRDVLASLVPLALLRCEGAARDARIRALGCGLAAAVAVYAGDYALGYFGVDSLVAAHAVIAIATLLACAIARQRPYAAAFAMYAGLIVWTLFIMASGPDRGELAHGDFYWRFARLALTIWISASAVRIGRPFLFYFVE